MFKIVNIPKNFATDLYGYDYFNEVMYKVEDGVENISTSENFSTSKFWKKLIEYFDDPSLQNIDTLNNTNNFKKSTNKYIFKYNSNAYELTTKPNASVEIKRIPKEKEYSELIISYFNHF